MPLGLVVSHRLLQEAQQWHSGLMDRLGGAVVFSKPSAMEHVGWKERVGGTDQRTLHKSRKVFGSLGLVGRTFSFGFGDHTFLASICSLAAVLDPTLFLSNSS